MAQYLVLDVFEQQIAGQDWRFRPGDVIDDAVGVITAAEVLALGAAGLCYVAYTGAVPMTTMRTAYLSEHGRDDYPPSMAPYLVQYAIGIGAITPLTGAVDPSGVVTGNFGQLYRDTVLNIWHICRSNPSGTVWVPVADLDVLNSIVGGAEGAAQIGTDAKANLGGATDVEAALTFIEGQDPTAFSAGAADPNTGAGTAGAVGDTYVATTPDVAFTNVTGAATGWRPSQDEDLGATACLLIEQGGQPVAAQLLTIGADVYEADGAGANINFAISGVNAEGTMDNLLAAAVANGTEDLFWDKLDATHLRLRSADAPQGNVISANPALAVANTLANYTLSTGTPGNLNTEGGRAAGLSRRSVSIVTVTAAHATQAELRICFPFTVARIGMIQVLTAAGALKMAVTDTFTIDHGDVLITLGGGGGDIAATDIVTVEAWS